MGKGVNIVTLISSYAFPANNATANRLRFMVNAIAKGKTHSKVQIIAAPSDSTSQHESSSGLQIETIKIKKSKNLLLRALKEYIFAVKSVLKMDSSSTFLVFTIPSPIILVATFFNKNRSFGIDVRDCSWDYLANKGLLSRVAAILLIVVHSHSCVGFNPTATVSI